MNSTVSTVPFVRYAGGIGDGDTEIKGGISGEKGISCSLSPTKIYKYHFRLMLN